MFFFLHFHTLLFIIDFPIISSLRNIVHFFVGVFLFDFIQRFPTFHISDMPSSNGLLPFRGLDSV